ncbi:MAG TPA: TetR/AcrR family transcriptional regulator C-terminal domain-containing protein [Actinomycetota bacterium]|nr:TetR/AcrR family transcriptional regulator C-terminal domain-containing protein [Actinomycetota bacterium]
MPTKVTRHREPLTRDQVVDAALRLMDDEGLDAVSMRRVAREVGVEAMSLYNHVRDKEDLLDGVVERIMAGFRFPDGGAVTDPVTYGRTIALEWRALLKAHPNVIALFAHQHKPMRSLGSLRPMEVALQTLRDMGLSVEDSLRAFQVIGGYIMGYVMMETGQMFTPGDDDAGVFALELPADELPCIAATIPYMADCDVDAQFEFGLDLMLDGLAARAARRDA